MTSDLASDGLRFQNRILYKERGNEVQCITELDLRVSKTEKGSKVINEERKRDSA
jgi:hypothetical protein